MIVFSRFWTSVERLNLPCRYAFPKSLSIDMKCSFSFMPDAMAKEFR